MSWLALSPATAASFCHSLDIAPQREWKNMAYPESVFPCSNAYSPCLASLTCSTNQSTQLQHPACQAPGCSPGIGGTRWMTELAVWAGSSAGAGSADQFQTFTREGHHVFLNQPTPICSGPHELATHVESQAGGPRNLKAPSSRDG